MPNSYGMQLPQINTQGVYDILGNSMSRGLGSMYAVQGAQLEQDQGKLKYEEMLNELQNKLKDNPNLDLARKVTAGNLGIDQSLLDQGITKEQKTQAALGDTETSKAKGSNARMVQQLEQSQVLQQAVSRLDDINKSVGGDPSKGALAKTQYWENELRPMLKKYNIHVNDDGPTVENEDKLRSAAKAALINVPYAQKLGEILAQVGGHVQAAQIGAQASKYGHDVQAATQMSDSSHVTGQLALAVASGKATPSQQQAFDALVTARYGPGLANAANNSVETKFAAAKLMMAKAAMDDAVKSKDPEKIKNAYDMVEKAEKDLDEARTRAQSVGGGQVPTQAPDQVKKELDQKFANGYPKNEQELSKVKVTKDDIGKTVTIGNTKYLLTPQGWKKSQ